MIKNSCESKGKIGDMHCKLCSKSIKSKVKKWLKRDFGY
jgi:hypothetical protein